jgi:hypothetical protein
MSARKVARRDFLKAGSAAAIGFTAVALTPQSLFAAPPRDRGILPLLSVGYAPEIPEPGHSVRLAAADKALLGDPAFISRGARVTIQSFARAERYEGMQGGAGIDVIHPVIGYAPEKYPRFKAWTYSVDKNLDNIAGPIRFTVPVTGTQGLQLVIRRVTFETDEPATESLLPLTLGSEFGALKLQRGVYVIAFREAARDSVPPWTAHSVRSKGGQLVVDTEAFSYAVLTIDYAGGL